MAWTKEEESILLKMRADNENLLYIARKLNTSYSSVVCKLHRMRLVREYKPWTTKEFQQAKLMYASGMSYKKISEKLGRTRGSIQSRFEADRRLRNEN